LKEQYAADSGVEYALFQLQNGMTTGQHSYTLNKKAVDVTWGEYITETYKITSVATSHSYGSSTRIESYVSLEVVDSPWLLADPPASPADATIQPHSDVSGTVASSSTTVRVQVRTYRIYP
jgi:hypothetical protein